MSAADASSVFGLLVAKLMKNGPAKGAATNEYVTLDALRAHADRHGVPSEAIMRQFERADADKDGRLTFTEFATSFKNAAVADFCRRLLFSTSVPQPGDALSAGATAAGTPESAARPRRVKLELQKGEDGGGAWRAPTVAELLAAIFSNAGVTGCALPAALHRQAAESSDDGPLTYAGLRWMLVASRFPPDKFLPK